MAELFRRLPGFKQTPAGLERTILRGLPKVLLYGSLLLLLPPLLLRVGADPAGAWWTARVDIFAVALLVLHWTAVLTVGIGAFIVMVMKGPAYVADAYPLERDADAAGR
jgi:hypothetical protein